jgi:hypothetical protein
MVYSDVLVALISFKIYFLTLWDRMSPPPYENRAITIYNVAQISDIQITLSSVSVI